MNKKELDRIAKEISIIEKSNTNQSIKFKEIDSLIKGCSPLDLIKIDEIIQKKYLTF